MRLITRYILLELLKVFSVTLMGMTAVLLLACVAQEAVRQGLEPVADLSADSLSSCRTHWFLPFPGRSCLPCAVCTGGWRRTMNWWRRNRWESPRLSFLAPGFILAFLVSLTAVWLNDVAASWGRQGVQRVVLQSVEQIAYGMLRTQRAYSTEQFSIHVADVEGRKLIRPLLTFPLPTATRRHLR